MIHSHAFRSVIVEVWDLILILSLSLPLSVIFVNNFAFGPEVDHQLKERFANMKEGGWHRSLRQKLLQAACVSRVESQIQLGANTCITATLAACDFNIVVCIGLCDWLGFYTTQPNKVDPNASP